jgi:hypothetical protein
MKTAIIKFGVLSLVAFVVTPANADTYSSTTTTEQAPSTEYRTTTVERAAPVTEVRTTTVESAPSTTTVVRETPIYVEPSQNTTTIIKEKKKHHHLIKVPFMSVD